MSLDLENAQSFLLADGSYILLDRWGTLWQVRQLSQTTPQSTPEPASASLPSDPIPTPKRGPGRPRKTPQAQAAPTPEFKPCPLCGMEIARDLAELHVKNCRAAAAGYTTHEAQPGKSGQSDL